MLLAGLLAKNSNMQFDDRATRLQWHIYPPRPIFLGDIGGLDSGNGHGLIESTYVFVIFLLQKHKLTFLSNVSISDLEAEIGVESFQMISYYMESSHTEKLHLPQK